MDQGGAGQFRLTNVRGVVRGRIETVTLQDAWYTASDYTDYSSRADQPVTDSAHPTRYGFAPVTANTTGVGWRAAELQQGTLNNHFRSIMFFAVRWSDNGLSNVTATSNFTPTFIHRLPYLYSG